MESKARKEMDPQFQWDLSHIYADNEAWEQAYKQAESMVGELGALKGTLCESPESMKNALDKIYAASELTERVYLYALLNKESDNSNPEYQAMQGRATNLYVAFSTTVSFVDPEILSMEEEKLSAFWNEPILSGYKHILQDTNRVRAHTLDEARETMLAKLGDAAQTADNCFTMLESCDMSFPKIRNEKGEEAELTHGSYGVYLRSGDREVRKNAFETYFSEFKRYLNTFAATYSGSVKMDCFYADVRGYESACQSALYSGNVPVSVYDALVEAIHESLPIMRRYLELRKKVLKLDELHMYDLYCPMVDNVEYNVSLEECEELVRKATAPLGPVYAEHLEHAFKERWMDIYENKGKTTGAFSCGVYGVHPYVLLNFQGQLEDVFTMAHELGHSMHSSFSSETQDYANHDYRIMVAEVASTVNEVLLTKYLLKTETDPKKRIFILNHFLEGFRTTVFRQTLFAEFERMAHEKYEKGEPITAEVFNQIYRDLNLLYYDGCVVDELQDIEWARIPHFYSAFYVYQYATGFCSAVAIADAVLKSGDASDYLKFLSTGGSDYPLEELKIAGIDLTRPETVRNAMKVFSDSLEELEALLNTNE